MNREYKVLFNGSQWIVTTKGEYDTMAYRVYWGHSFEDAVRYIYQIEGPVLLSMTIEGR